jgi:T-complex protein 1 subunit delta
MAGLCSGHLSFSSAAAAVGDGTTSICVIAGAFLQACSELLTKGIHPTIIAEAFKQCAVKAADILTSIATPIHLTDRADVLNAVKTCLSSKVVHNNADILAPIAVDAVLSILTEGASNVDLRNVKIVKQVGGTIDDTELVKGVVLEQGKLLEGTQRPPRFLYAQIPK